MGLDMYAYVANKANQRSEYYEGAVWDDHLKHFTNPVISQPRELAYWRKHPSLHGYMYNLWVSKGNTGEFNGDELELTWEDIDDLERAVIHGKLPFTEGFFFGKPADNVYFTEDLKFCTDAKAEIFLGFKVFYNSSW
jgi:hypothetical protein